LSRDRRKPILLAALAVLPLRGVLYTLSDDRFWLVAVQLLDGVGNGILGAMTPLVVADLMRGTGRYNVSLGAIATVHGGLVGDPAGHRSIGLTAAFQSTAFAEGYRPRRTAMAKPVQKSVQSIARLQPRWSVELVRLS
jgi:hypothetical protein